MYDPKFSTCTFPDYFEFRDFQRFKDENFKVDPRKESWDSIHKCNEGNESYSRFLHILHKVSNIHALLKKAKTKHKANKPWITPCSKKSMKVREKSYTVLCKSNASEMREFRSLFTRTFQESSRESSSDNSRPFERYFPGTKNAISSKFRYETKFHDDKRHFTNSVHEISR